MTMRASFSLVGVSSLAAAAAALLGLTLAPVAGCSDDATVDPAGAGSGASGGIGGEGGLFMSGPTTTGSGAGGAGTGGMQNVGGYGQVGFEWDNTYGGSGSAFVRDVAIDSSGNVIIVGAFSGSVDFGGGTKDSSGGGTHTNVFVAKYSSTGDFVWAESYGSGLVQVATAVAVDAQGNIGLCGAFIGSLNFGAGAITNGDQFSNAYAAKLTAAGDQVFATAFTNPVATTDECHGVAFDGSGNMWLAGWYQSTIDLGGGALAATGGGGDRDMFVGKFDAAGAHLVSKNFGGQAFDRANDIAVAPDGSVGIVGYTEGNLNFGAGDLPGQGGKRAFVARLTANAEHVHSSLFAGDGDADAIALAMAADGDLLATGTFKGSIDLGDGVIEANGANDDSFLARYSAAGTFEYAARISSSASEQVTDIAVDSQGFAVLSGTFNGSVNAGPEVLETAGDYDGFLLKRGPEDGHGYWGFRFGAVNSDAGRAVAVDGGDNIVLVGDFSGNIDLGSGPITGEHSQEIFVAKYSD